MMRFIRSLNILFTLFLSSQSLAQWRPLGPFGGPISTLHSGSRVSFAAGPTGGLFRSTDGGRTWAVGIQGITASPVLTALVEDSVALIGTFSNGIFRSTDGGQLWRPGGRFEPAQSAQPACEALLRLPGGTLMAATRQGVYRSGNNGDTWRAINSGLATNDGVLSLFRVGNAVLAGTGAGIFRTTNNGDSWTLVRQIGRNSRDAREGNVYAITQSGNALFAGTFGLGVYRSFDEGLTWVTANGGLPAEVTVFTIQPTMQGLFIGTDQGLYRSVNGGNVWTRVSNFPSGANITGISQAGGSLLVSTDADGVFRSDDFSATWTASNNGLLAETRQMVLNGSKIWVVSGGNVVRSLDGGQTWTVVRRRTDDLEIIEDLARDGNTLYLTNGDLFRSTDDGTTWQRISQGVPEGVKLTTLWVQGNDLFAATPREGVARSIDGGRTWQFLGRIGLPGPDRIMRTVLFHRNALFAGYSGAGLYRTTDNGATWTQVTGIRETSDVWTLRAVNDTLYAGTNNESFYRSLDNGVNWTRLSTGIPAYTVRSILPVGNNLYIGTLRGVRLSTTKGAFWRRFDSGLPLLQTSLSSTVGEDLQAFPLALNGNTLFASTLFGVWSRSITDQPVITTDPLPADLCVGGRFTVGFGFSDSFDEPNNFQVQLSNADGTFAAAPPVIGECRLTGNALLGLRGCPLEVRFPANTQPGNNYRIRVLGTNPRIIGPEVGVRVVPNPVPTKPTIRTDSTVLQSSPATGYQWLLNNRPIPGATAQTFNTRGQAGVYAVRVSNECGGAAVSDDLLYNVTAVLPPIEDLVTVFPNPTDDVVTVRFPSHAAATRIRLIRPNGATLTDVSVPTPQTEHRLSTRHLPAGVYLLQITQGQHQTTRRVLKQ